MDGRSHSSVRVLVRPPPPRAPPIPPTATTQNGVVVVGFIGNRSDDVAHLMNKVIDSNVFGSGNLDSCFKFDDADEIISKWLETKDLSFYHHVEKGVLYVRFSGSGCGLTGHADEEDIGWLQGLLFMFSVCHVVVLIQEGSRFDTRVLQKFRLVQAAKNALSSFSKSQNVPSVASRHRSSPGNPSPGKSRGRNGSTFSIMSGLGTYTSLLPGQCTPVILFVFLDDFTDIRPSVNPEEPSDSPVNSSTNPNSSSRQGPHMKGAGSVVLARPGNKSETDLRKKIQSSLEAQIRFSIKKCRVLSVSSPVFSLDASKAVSLIDFSSCQSGESLEFAINLVEEVLDGKATPDSLLLDSHQHNGNKEDILSLKEFISRQSDMLRGRTGSVSTTTSGSAGGGMAAVAAAAAAAASASSGNTMKNVQELPSKELWSSSCQLILNGIIHDKSLVNGIGMNHKFSDQWCEKAFPVAKEIYLKDLPACYTSSKHNDRLRKALLSLTSMVKGPAVQFYIEKLKNECNSIWSCGRQQCDAVSLTGKPCINLRHEMDPHSSGYVYLHACACGRSRSPRPDPFDYETANVCNIADCDKLLPNSQFLEGSLKETSHWNLIRIGNAKYYDPSKGLVQSGFSATQKFLLRWIISEKLSEVNHSLNNDFQKISLETDSNVDITVDGDKQISNQLVAGKMQSGIDSRVGPTSDVSQAKNVSFGKGSSNFTMKKPFSEVVAGSAAGNSAFPPLFSRKQHLQVSDRNIKQHQGLEKSRELVSNQESENGSSVNKASVDNGIAGDRYKDGNPILQVGSNVIPLNMNDKQIKASNTMKHVTAYVGFEHECPRGHRFILNLDHVNELGSSYAVSEDNTASLSAENLEKKKDYYKFSKFGRQGGSRRQFSGEGIGKSKSLEKLKEKGGNGNLNFNKSMQSTRQRKDHNGKLKTSHSVKDFESDDKPMMDDMDCVFPLLNRSLPIYMYCPYCRDSVAKHDTSDVKFASTISQLQRIFVVTPSFPIVLAADPIIQFEVSCLPSSVPDREQKLQFSLGCPVILPPESLISLRLPFVYGVTMADGSIHSLQPFENEPHLTAWVLKGTSLQVVSQTSNLDLGAAT